MSSPSKNILWLTISRILSLVLLFFAYTQLFRYLGPYNSGQFQFVLSYATLFGVIVDFGIQQYIIKRISEDPQKAKHYFYHFLAIEIVLVTIVYSGMLAIAWAAGYEPIVIKAIAVAGLGVALYGLIYPFLSVMSAFYDLKKVAFLNFLNSAVNVTVIFLSIALGGSIVMLVSQQAVFALIALGFYYHFVKRHIGEPRIFSGITHLDSHLVKTILKAAVPFALLVGFSTIYNRIDVVLITKILDYTQTGLYTAAYKFFDLIAFFPAVVSHALYPVFASLMVAGNKEKVRDTFEKYMRLMIALALPMAVGGMILAKPIIVLLAGDAFTGAAPVLAILVWAPAMLFVYIVANSIVVSQMTKFAMVITGANVAVNILGNIILLPRIGIIGAAIMTIVSEFLQGIFYFYFVRKKITKFRFFGVLWQPMIASATMGLIVWYLKDSPLIPVVALGVVVYASILFILGYIKREDIAFVRSLIGKGYASSQALAERNR